MTDPFDDLDDGDDRDGDPFAELGNVDAPTEGDGPDGDSAEHDDDPVPGVPDAADEGLETDATDRADAGAVPGEQVDVTADPFGEVDVSRGDPFEAADSPFQQVDVAGVDPDEVWERFTADAASESEGEQPERDVVVVSKHEFCEGCPHVTAPPDVECTHDGTAIVEFVGPDDVRVENCPIVRERRELGEIHE
jgi:hypothetical protein